LKSIFLIWTTGKKQYLAGENISNFAIEKFFGIFFEDIMGKIIGLEIAP